MDDYTKNIHGISWDNRWDFFRWGEKVRESIGIYLPVLSNMGDARTPWRFHGEIIDNHHQAVTLRAMWRTTLRKDTLGDTWSTNVLKKVHFQTCSDICSISNHPRYRDCMTIGYRQIQRDSSSRFPQQHGQWFFWKSPRLQTQPSSQVRGVSGWWLGHPSEKYESQLGWWDSQYFWENKIDGNQTTNQLCILIITWYPMCHGCHGPVI